MVHDAEDVGQGRAVGRRARVPDMGGGEHPPLDQDVLPDGDPDAGLELEPVEGQHVVEKAGGPIGVAKGVPAVELDQEFGIGETGHDAHGPPVQLLESVEPPEGPEDLEGLARQFPHRVHFGAGGRVLEFDVPDVGGSLEDRGDQLRGHGDSGGRRVVVNDDRDIHGARYPAVVGQQRPVVLHRRRPQQNGVRSALTGGRGHALGKLRCRRGNARHCEAFGKAGPEPPDHLSAFLGVQLVALSSTQNGQAVHPAVDHEAGQPVEAPRIQRPVRGKGGGDDGVDPFEFH